MISTLKKSRKTTLKQLKPEEQLPEISEKPSQILIEISPIKKLTTKLPTSDSSTANLDSERLYIVLYLKPFQGHFL